MSQSRFYMVLIWLIDFDSIKNQDGLVYYTNLVDFAEPFKGEHLVINVNAWL